MGTPLELLRDRLATLRFVASQRGFSKNKKEAALKIPIFETAISILERAEGKSDSTSEKDLRVCEVMPRFDSPKNWNVDYNQENGNYTCRCCRCKENFFGNKHRVLCRECAEQLVDDSL